MLGVVKFLLILFVFAYSGAATAVPENDFAKKAHDAYVEKDFLNSGMLYEQAYKSKGIEVYLENAISAYLHYSFDCLNEKNYDHAIKFCEKVLSLSPQDKNAKEILSDVYYSRGTRNFYKGLNQKALEDIQKSLEYSVISEQREKAQAMLTRLSNSKNNKIYYKKPFVKKLSNNASLPEVLEMMELKIYGETFEGRSVVERVKRLEDDVLGHNNTQYGLTARVEKLKRKVLPELLHNKA